MIKFFECPDIHFDMNWIDVSRLVFKSIREASIKEQVDFIAMPGDLLNRPILATEKGGINELRALIRSLTDICPVVAVEGTPSHDGRGSYDHLEELGLVLLRPNKVYALNDSYQIIEISGQNPFNPQCILFGIPELSKANIQAQLGLSAEQANAETVKQFKQYIDSFLAPMRLRYEAIPAVCLFHGNVSDSAKENEIDVVLKSSDIIIHTEDMESAGIDRWSLGHIHTPWESKRINAGYAGFTGIDDSPWGKCGFVPAMNLQEWNPIGCFRGERIPYGTPYREKISEALPAYSPAIAYWLETSDPSAIKPAGHPWSRITYIETKQTSNRITAEQYKTVQSLRDLFRLNDPAIPEQILAKVDQISAKIGQNQTKSIDLSIDSIEIWGSVFWKGKRIEFYPSKQSPGLTQITGGNGKGKSCLLAFCSQYPVVIGKDTRSGRPSAIKDFFNSPDSGIRKSITFNNQKHEHLITIKGAHTQTAKVECYITIDGKPYWNGGFDEMMTECEKLYGSFDDWFLTTFYVQPLQGKAQTSLMSATMTDIQKLVQNIAGVDREKEREEANNQINQLTKEIEDKESWLKGAEAFGIDVGTLETQISELKLQLEEARIDLLSLEKKGKDTRNQLETLQKKKEQNDQAKQKKADADLRLQEIHSTSLKLFNSIEDLKKMSASLSDYQIAIKIDDEMIAIKVSNKEKKNTYDAEINNYNRKIGEIKKEYEDKLLTFKQKKHVLENEIIDFETYQKRLNNPCPNCGWQEPESKNQIEYYKSQETEARTKLHILAEPIEPPINLLPKPPQPSYDSELPILPNRAEILKQIETGMKAGALLEAERKALLTLEVEQLELQSRTYQIDYEIDQSVETTRKALDSLQSEYREATADIRGVEIQIKEQGKQLEDEQKRQEEIKKTKIELMKALENHSDWKYIATQLQPNKIPALELEMIISEIDTEAIHNLSPYQSGIYSFRTVTQQEGKKQTIDKFDILIHNAETGEEESFIVVSPGVKTFLNDAYVKALIRIRNNRHHRKYSPVILDEADSPVEIESIPIYYEMQDRFFGNQNLRVLVVSHTPVTGNYIQNQINIEELKK